MRGSTWTTPPPLRDCLEPFASVYDAWKVESLRTEWWQSCLLPVNWKVATAAFMEGYHVPQTHPQLLPTSSNGSSSGQDLIKKSLYFMRALGEGMGGMTHENDIRIAEGLQNIELPADPSAAMATWRSTLNDAVVAWHRARGCEMPDSTNSIAAASPTRSGFAFRTTSCCPPTAAPRHTGSVHSGLSRRCSRSGRLRESRRTE